MIIDHLLDQPYFDSNMIPEIIWTKSEMVSVNQESFIYLSFASSKAIRTKTHEFIYLQDELSRETVIIDSTEKLLQYMDKYINEFEDEFLWRIAHYQRYNRDYYYQLSRLDKINNLLINPHEYLSDPNVTTLVLLVAELDQKWTDSVKHMFIHK